LPYNNGCENLEITVSSGFNAEKTEAFVAADKVYQQMHNKPLFDNIGTGSIAKPIPFLSINPKTSSSSISLKSFGPKTSIPYMSA